VSGGTVDSMRTLPAIFFALFAFLCGRRYGLDHPNDMGHRLYAGTILAVLGTAP